MVSNFEFPDDLEARLRAGLKLRRHPIKGGDEILDEWVWLYYESWTVYNKNIGEQRVEKGFVVDTINGTLRFDEQSPDAFELACELYEQWVDWERYKATKDAFYILTKPNQV